MSTLLCSFCHYICWANKQVSCAWAANIAMASKDSKQSIIVLCLFLCFINNPVICRLWNFGDSAYSTVQFQ